MKKPNIVQAKTFNFSKDIITFLGNNRHLPGSIKNQLLRSATSIGANVVEAKGSSSKKEFIRFYQIALKSSNETEYWLSIIMDGYSIDAQGVLEKNQEISKIIAASIITMKGKRKAE